MVSPYNATLFVNLKECNTDTCKNMNEHWKHYAKWEESVTKDHILYDSIYMKCQEEANA